VRLDGEWIDVPNEAVITEPNRVGRTMVLPLRGYLSAMTTKAGRSSANPAPDRALAPFPHVYFLSRSSSSTEMPCGPRMKQMRTPGRMVVGSFVNSTPFALISAATASMSFTVSPK
jgi:hypothetical protein